MGKKFGGAGPETPMSDILYNAAKRIMEKTDQRGLILSPDWMDAFAKLREALNDYTQRESPSSDIRKEAREPVAYLVEYRETIKGGNKRRCVIASLEPRTPLIIMPEETDIASRDLLNVMPLFTAQRESPSSAWDRCAERAAQACDSLAAWEICEELAHRIRALKGNYAPPTGGGR